MKLKTKAKILLVSLIISGLITNSYQFSAVYATGGIKGGMVSLIRPHSDDSAVALNTRKLFSLIQHDKLDEIKKMLQPGIDVNNLRFGPNWTPLHFAAMMGRHRIVKYLVERCGANTQVLDEENQTPSTLAQRNGEQLIAIYLNLHSSDISEKNRR